MIPSQLDPCGDEITSYPVVEFHGAAGWKIKCDLAWRHDRCAWIQTHSTYDAAIHAMQRHVEVHAGALGQQVVLDLRTPEEREAEDKTLLAQLLATKARLDHTESEP